MSFPPSTLIRKMVGFKIWTWPLQELVKRGPGVLWLRFFPFFAVTHATLELFCSEAVTAVRQHQPKGGDRRQFKEQERWHNHMPITPTHPPARPPPARPLPLQELRSHVRRNENTNICFNHLAWFYTNCWNLKNGRNSPSHFGFFLKIRQSN